jgi:hypothetical protein
MVNLLKAGGIPARKSHPEGAEGRAHYTLYEDIPGILIAWESLRAALLEKSLTLMKDFVLQRIKDAVKNALARRDSRDVGAQFRIGVKKPDGTVVSIRYAGEGPDEYQEFMNVDHSKLFNEISRLNAMPPTIPTSIAPYVSHPNRDTYHKKECRHILRDVEPELAGRSLVGHNSAAEAVKLDKRPCKHCKPPWID